MRHRIDFAPDGREINGPACGRPDAGVQLAAGQPIKRGVHRAHARGAAARKEQTTGERDEDRRNKAEPEDADKDIAEGFDLGEAAGDRELTALQRRGQ